MNENDKLLRRGVLLERITLSWNVVGAAIVFVAAARAGSVALSGFGLDSLVEIAASIVVIRELNGTGENQKRALRFIAASFFALALYILAQAGCALAFHSAPAASPLGIVWLSATCAAMLALAVGKHRVGTRLDHAVLLAESRVTLVDALLAASVLAGLVFNAAFGWWRADPLSGLLIVFYGFKEGLHAWREST